MKSIKRIITALGCCGLAVTVALTPAGASADGDVNHDLISPATPSLSQRLVALDIDSGRRFNRGGRGGAAVVYEETIRVPGAVWLRLKFSNLELAGDLRDGTGGYLRITSLKDGAQQILDAVTAEQWRYSSAYFNGDAVRVELIAFRAEGPARIRFDFAWAGTRDPSNWSQCGPTDDRLPSDDPRSARAVPIGCTVFIIDDFRHCFLTAGHCAGGSLDVIEFNVPPSDSQGNIVHPGPEDQYAVDDSSVQSAAGGVGDDWAYFGCFPNSNTGLTPYEAQGAFYELADVPPPVQGQDIRITGYGVDSSPPERNQTQQTHAGPYFDFSGTRLQYRADTQGGNSGSGVQDDSTGLVIGIHTHGGCNTDGTGANSGTAIHHPNLQNALANPRGVCAGPMLLFSYPNGLPDAIPPSGGPGFIVEITAEPGIGIEPGTETLHYDDGGGFVDVPLNDLGGGLYEASFPSLPCGSEVAFYVSAQADDGRTFTDPRGAPQNSYSALVAEGLDIAFEDDFESDLGWMVENVDLQDGQWERGIPVNGGRGDPPADYDGSGFCYITDNQSGNSDVDGGPTRLISPILDLTSAADPQVRYARWFTNDDNDADRLTVEISNNGGASWTLVESVGNSIGWIVQSFRVADFVAPSDQVVVRFSATDNPNDSVTEAGIDAFEVFDILCDAGTRLTGFNIVTGTLLDGVLNDLESSDDSYVHTRSGFGPTVVDLHHMEMLVNAVTTVNAPSTVNLSIESRIDEPAGTMQVRLRNWTTGAFDFVGSAPIGNTDDVDAFPDIDAADHVNGSGEIEASIRHIVFVPFLAFTFESWLDWLEISVQ